MHELNINVSGRYNVHNSIVVMPEAPLQPFTGISNAKGSLRLDMWLEDIKKQKEALINAAVGASEVSHIC